MKSFLFRFLILPALLVLFSGCGESPPAEQSCNFALNKLHRRVSWARLPIRFYADDSVTDEMYHGIIAAMDVWNKLFNEPVFELIGRSKQLPDPLLTDDGKVVSDSFNGIYVLAGSEFENSTARDEQARTSISFRGDFIYEADVLIDGTEKFYFEDIELQASQARIHFKSLMIHEFGHVLGLDHIDHVADSVMQSKLQFGEFRVDFADEDVESLSCEY